MVDKTFFEHAPETVKAGSYDVSSLYTSRPVISFILSKVNRTQIAFNLFEEIANNKDDLSVNVYSLENELPIDTKAKTSIFPANSLNSQYVGICVATDIESLGILSQCLNPCQKYLYLYDLAFLMNPNAEQVLGWIYNLATRESDPIQVIIRSSDCPVFKRINLPFLSISNFNLKDFVKLCRQ